MKKLATTIAAALVLSLGILVPPVGAEDVPMPCEPVWTPPADDDNALAQEVESLRAINDTLDNTVVVLTKQQRLADAHTRNLERKVKRQQATIKRLRAELNRR